MTIKYLKIGLIALLLFSCTKRFDEINRNEAKVSEITDAEIPFLFAKALQVGAPFSYQTYQNLYADLYAQYFAVTSSGFPTDRYNIRVDWLDNNWRNQFTSFAPQLKTIMDFKGAGSPEYAIASIWWVYGFHHLTDYFGPLPYYGLGQTEEPILYASQQEIYDDFFNKLRQAVEVLEATDRNNIFGGHDLIYQGNKDRWIKFANTLRLRLAMRISYVDPYKAQQEAESAVAGGVMESPQEDAMLTKALAGNDSNPLARISVWREFAMSSTMYSYLVGYEDPRLEHYFQKVPGLGEYKALRNGQPNSELNRPEHQANQLSQIGPSWVRWDGASWKEEGTRKQDIMHAAEAYFLRAEGALNGWNMGADAASLYEQGIRTSMLQWGITDQETIEWYINSTATPIAVPDVTNSDPVSNLPIKFSINSEEQRAQIITQKWLAIYPDGFEAWAEYRRTGYPKLYELIQNDASQLADGEKIKRLPFPSLEYQTNNEGLMYGIQLLGGPDNLATRLWWDVR